MIYTTPQVADMLQISERSVKRLLACKELKSMKVGHMRRISQAQLDEYMETVSNG